MKPAEFDVNNLLEDDDADLKEELQACQQYPVDSGIGEGRSVFSISPCQPATTI